MIQTADVVTLIGAVGALLATITGLIVALKTKGDVTQIKSTTVDTQTQLHEAGVIEPPK
jgi:hypothetical protein